ncbi:MAG TPA: (d)CMP kinase [Candidatus Baltobacteraceae bacterium]|nr:(d)CMP kinase [Candidatus Baltobacteraceae bacterium]
MTEASSARRLVIAIDGPVGSGKSTMARRLAATLGLVYIDSGAMYRAMGWQAIRAGLPLDDQPGLTALAARTAMRVVSGPAGPRILVDGEDVTDGLRTPAIDQAASVVSTCPAVRERLVALQRACAKESGVVMDGRDIGTVVFPDAHLKFFLDADLAVRAARRGKDLERAGTPMATDQLHDEIARRDARDISREHSPLRAAPDAIRIDSSGLDPEQVLARMLTEVERFLQTHKP